MLSAAALRVRARVALALIAVLVVASVFLGWRVMGGVDRAFDDVSTRRAERMLRAAQLETAAAARGAALRGYLLTASPDFLAELVAARRAFVDALAALDGHADPAALDELRRLSARLAAAGDEAVRRRADDPDAARRGWARDASPLQARISAGVVAVRADEVASFARSRQAAAAGARTARRMMMALLVVLLCGVALAVAVFARVVNALMLQQRQLERQTAFQILDHLPVGVFVLDGDGRPFYSNRAIARMLGRRMAPHDDATGMLDPVVAGTGTSYPTERLPHLRALEGVASEASDVELRRAGDVVPVHIHGAPVRDRHGRIRFSVSAIRDIRELQRIAQRDALTGVGNRAAFAQAFRRERMLAERTGATVSLAVIDLDHFKSINDTHGHAMGDQVLRRVAGVVGERLRRTDVVGRWGGEEFVVMFPSTGAASAAIALDHVLSAVRAERFTGAAAAFGVTFSAGVVLVASGEPLDDAVARADRLLYQAKQRGRDQVVVDGPLAMRAVAG